MNRSVTENIINEIALHEGVRPIELPPMWHTIDTEALDAIVASADDGRHFQIEFSYSGYDIIVQGENDIQVVKSEHVGRMK